MTSQTAPMLSPSQPVKQPPVAVAQQPPVALADQPPVAPPPAAPYGHQTLPDQPHTALDGPHAGGHALPAGSDTEREALPGDPHAGREALPDAPVKVSSAGPLPDEPGVDGDGLADASGLDELPVLAEVPELGALLEDLRQVDRIIAAAIDTLRLFEDTGAVEMATGVDIDHWLSIVARRTSSDIRMLHLAVTISRRVPHLAGLFTDGKLSWAQMRAICLQMRQVPRLFDQAIDNQVTYELSLQPDLHPDNAVHLISQVISSHEHDHTDEEREDVGVRERFLALQPRLDGTGGLIHGDADALSFATIDAALTPSRNDLGAHTTGQQRLDRLVNLCDTQLAGATTPADTTNATDATDATDAPETAGVIDTAGQVGKQTQGGSMRSRPQLLVRLPVDTLLDRTQMPADLLTSLLGGAMHVNAATARQLINERGADLRTVLIDHGTIVGVGRRTRTAPGWLADALLALHDTCTAPGCRTAARICDIDHATPWTPTATAGQSTTPAYPRTAPVPSGPSGGTGHGPDRSDITAIDTGRGGRTDVDQLAPVCGPHNRAKESDGWHVQQQADGTRRWHHPRTGLTTTTAPATWRAPSQANAPP